MDDEDGEHGACEHEREWMEEMAEGFEARVRNIDNSVGEREKVNDITHRDNGAIRGV